MSAFSPTESVSKLDFIDSFQKVSNVPGTPGYGLTFGQDGNFPFPYDPATDTYWGYRWDFKEEVDTNKIGIRDPLTKSHVESLTGLYLTSHPFFYSGFHLENPGRLTKVTFRKPNTLMVPSISGVAKESWCGDPTKPADFILTPIGQRYVAMGYNSFYYNHCQGSPELLIINPKEFVTGAIWVDFKQGELQGLFRSYNAAVAMTSFFNSMTAVDSDHILGFV